MRLDRCAAFIATAFAMCAMLGPFARAASAAVPVVADAPRVAVRDLGPLGGSRRLRIAVTLRYRDDAGLDRLLDLQETADSQIYRRWLTPRQFATAFAPTPEAYGRVIHALQRAGFSIERTYPNRTVIDASAPARDVERFFGTNIHRVMQPGSGERFVNVTAARAPAGLEDALLSVQGLDDLTVLHADHAFARRGDPVASTPLEPYPYWGPPSSVTGAAGYGPLAFTQAYDFPIGHPGKGGPYDGRGRSAAVVIESDFSDADLAGFLSYFQIARTGPPTVRVPIDGGPTQADVEAWLDVEAIVGAAPGVALYVYEFPNFSSNAYVTDAYEQVVTDDKADAVNSSFGGCENGQPAAARAWNALARQGAALGMTFSASSGDNGAPVCGGGPAPVDAPSDGEHVVAAGGTSLVVDAKGRYVSEVAWDSDGGASSGGISDLFAMPSWQAGVTGIQSGGRNVPDVALDADPNAGLALFVLGTWNTAYNPIGGTSLASPLFVASTVERAQLAGGRIGGAARALFRIFAHGGYGGNAHPFFHDIRQGSNGLFRAHAGYDNVTGIGSLDVWNVAHAR